MAGHRIGDLTYALLFQFLTGAVPLEQWAGPLRPTALFFERGDPIASRLLPVGFAGAEGGLSSSTGDLIDLSRSAPADCVFTIFRFAHGRRRPS